jgi:hypothetical protein
MASGLLGMRGVHAMATTRRPLLVTHSGTFHLDDAFAYAVLRLASSVAARSREGAIARKAIQIGLELPGTGGL